MEKIKLPLISYCRINFNHRKWAMHLVKCEQCKKEHEKLKLKFIEFYKNKFCECGCGKKITTGNSFLRGHHTKIPEYRLQKSKLWKDNNPMNNLKNRKYGNNNPSKRIDVRKKISENNPMKNLDYRKKCVENRKLAGYEKTILLNKTLWNDKKLLKKRIKTYCTNLSNGKIILKNNWKCGFYIKKDGSKEWFDSSYEENRMKYYDENNIEWTKKHGIKIPYINDKKKSTFYVPDFLININGKIIIDEIKGWIKKNDILKAKAGIKFCKKHNYSYRFYLGKNFEKKEKLTYEIFNG
jgi:hypothetical protein